MVGEACPDEEIYIGLNPKLGKGGAYPGRVYGMSTDEIPE
jgi:hypothetical protein